MTRTADFVRTLLHLPRRALTEPRTQEALGTDLELSFNLRPYVEALERNESLMILADGRRAHTHHSVRVVGVELIVAPGPVSIARSTGAALLPTFVVDDPGRTGLASLRLVIHPPIELQVTDDARADLEKNLGRFAAVYEQQIRAYPHNFNWTWVRDGAVESPRARRQRKRAPALRRDAQAPEHQVGHPERERSAS
jgi:lauroyl/myristoyl acyltransferase